ncbi:FxSxx-COOH system tetratricopeptide repeat protein [Streptosporangium sp. NBC_01755]|uniref:FxSxx-COOH system tetratricopeptide repeat protein n=1 Tax=unclassified Streptosporangium TaxID=2632669 RepID=UPI002DD7C25A|nr:MULTISPECIES: FxSxx-COOH system tetratricopeptide repeat protein [unclassified Streptosporangium]WSA27792.1 FxSxx-COOH system tetratricopeptide repeat protein [Streptosporangium sp. NBC_01810]WSD00733.1 FxSxx-COOH system tetratricopeptide repeat protein [Streptosporangium sp. NBC_01755]
MVELSHAANTVPERQPEVWEKVPPRNRNFTGRDDLLLKLRQGISTVTAVVPQPQALQGWGGVGKTHLAIEYAHRYRSHYDLVWWIPADQRVLVPSALAALAPYLGLPPVSATGVEEAAEAVRRTLQSGDPYRRWLLIFDNAEDPGQVEEFIPRGPGHVLITSRNPKWEDHFETLQVDVFTREESVAFLKKRLRREVPDEDSSRLAEQLGDLPLALEQAGALQYETGMSVDEYLEQLSEQASRLLGANRAPGYPLSMTAAWKVSVSLLQDRLPEAITVLRCCAFFGPEPIPRDVFRRGNRADVPRLNAILSDPILLATALSELRRFALARIEPKTRTIQVHRLVQALLRDDLPEKDQHEIRHEVHVLLAGSAPNDPDDTDKWRSFEELVAHVAPSGLEECTDPQARLFAMDMVRYLYRSGNYQSAHSFINGFIGRWTEISGPKHQDVLVAHKHLGNILRGLGQYALAYDVDHETLDRMTETLGPDHPETLSTINGYAASLRARGDFLGARRLDEESRTTHINGPGPTAPSTLRVLYNLALDYALTSDYAQARRLHQETYLEQSDATEGVSKGTLLLSWNSLARAVRLCGDYTEACDLGDEAYAYGVQELTLDHHYTLLAAKDLSIAKRRAGEIPEALELAHDTHTRFQRLFGDGHPDTMAAAINLSNALRTAGEIDEAFAIADRTVARYPRVYGADHPYTNACLGNLAILHRLRGDVSTARDLNEKVRKSLIAKVSQNHHYPLTCAISLQTDLAASGETSRARELGEDTLAKLRGLFGENHFLSLACASNLVLDRRATGAEQEAELLYADTMRRYERPLEIGHPDALFASEGRRIDCDFDPPPI